MTSNHVHEASAYTRQRCGSNRKSNWRESLAGDMCRATARSTLTKLLTAVLIVFIICLPELFQTSGGNTVVISCSNICAPEKLSSLFSSLNHGSLLCLLQQLPQEKDVFLKLPFNHPHTIASSASGSCRNTSRKLQHSEWVNCEFEGSISNFYQQLKSKDSKANGYLEVQRRNHHPLLKDFQFTVAAAEDAICGSFSVLLNISFRNSTAQDKNTTAENSNSSHINSLLDKGDNCINISLHLESYLLSPICTAWIIWLVLILFVFLLALNIIAYKVIRENRERLNAAQYTHRSTSAMLLASEPRSSNDVSRATTIPLLSGVPLRRRSSNFVHTSLHLGSIPEHNDFQCINNVEATENLVDRASEQDPDRNQDPDEIFT